MMTATCLHLSTTSVKIVTASVGRFSVGRGHVWWFPVRTLLLRGAALSVMTVITATNCIATMRSLSAATTTVRTVNVM